MGSRPADPDAGRRIQSELQRLFLAPAPTNLIFGFLAAGGMAGYLWSHSDQRGLIIWVSMVTLSLVPPAVMHSLKLGHKRFYWVSLASEMFSGFAWGSVSLIAMPAGLVEQAILLSLLVFVLMTTSTSYSHFLAIVVIFQTSLATTVWAGFLGSGEWPAAPLVGFWVIGMVYVTSVAFKARKTHTALVRANLDLESVNELLDLQARTDKLTGLANRLAFTEQLEQAIGAWATSTVDEPAPRSVTLAYLDIDRFKGINDDFGHHVGDDLLVQTAERLQAASTDSELVARLGGDELTVLSSVDGHTLGSRIQACFDKPFLIEDRSLDVFCSVGVATAEGETTSGSLMRDADAALYAAKAAGGGRHHVFGRLLRAQNEQRIELEAEIQGALLNGDIVPWLQPIIDLNTGEIVAAEALARWKHADGVRSAASFIDELRLIGMMSEYTDQLMHTIGEFQRLLERRGLPMITVNINVPSSHLQQVINSNLSFPVAIEITEETAITDVGATRQDLRAAQADGHSVWLDDFGTGFSSMSIAAELPIDGLKIDRGFVSRILSSPAVVGVVGAIVELSDRLSLDVVAEGVEHVDQARVLREFGIPMAQGHLWSPAVPLEEFAGWLETGHRFAVDQVGASSSSTIARLPRS